MSTGKSTRHGTGCAAMTDVTLRSTMGVELVDHMGDDSSIIRAARVSSGTDSALTYGNVLTGELAPKHRGLLNMLMRDRHGTPFEAVIFQWKIECPIFVAREFLRHRIA